MMEYDEVIEIEEIGYDDVYDIINYEECYNNEGNFFTNGLMVHNCIPEYVKRRDDKQQNWKKHEHPEIAEMLEETFGIIIYQEDLQAMWQKFAGFTAVEAEKARKAVAKKWTSQLEGIEKKWKRGAAKTLGKEWADEIWSRMTTFGRYAFNKCLGKDTILENPETNERMTVDQLYKSQSSYKLLSIDDANNTFVDIVDEVIDSGESEVYEIEFDNGVRQEVTLDHKFKCIDGKFRTVREIYANDISIVVSNGDHKQSY